jgi:hypothetical protein
MADTPPPAPPRSRLTGTLVWLGVLGALNVLFVTGMLMLVPRLKRSFDEFNLQLPWATKTVVQLADLYGRWWFALAPLQALLTLGGVALGRHLFRTPKAGNVFAAVCLFVLVGCLACGCGGLGLANLKLLEGVSK